MTHLKVLFAKVKASLLNGMLGDVSLKLIANVITTVIRNIVVLPALARYFTKPEYGELVTVIGIITTITAGFGNALLSTRLVMDADYRHKKLEGDFNSIGLIVSLISIAAVFPILHFFPSVGGAQAVFTVLLLFTETYVGYHSGWFILRQAYRQLLIYTLIGAAGFGIGLMLTKLTGLWTLTYLCSDVCCLAFLLLFSPLIREKKGYTPLLRVTLNKYSLLFLTTLLTNAIAYLDRLLLYPLIGSEAVATYTTASIFGKAFNLVAIPVSSILLGYYATEKIRLTLKKFWLISAVNLALLALFLLATRLAGVWFTGLLYPSLIDDARPFILIANLSSALGASAQITKSAALKYAKTYWTLLIQVIYAIIYAGGGLFAARRYGLKGFAEVVLIANTIQLAILYVVCTKALKHSAEVVSK